MRTSASKVGTGKSGPGSHSLTSGVAATYYSIDDQAARTYLAPFDVTGRWPLPSAFITKISS